MQQQRLKSVPVNNDRLAVCDARTSCVRDVRTCC